MKRSIISAHYYCPSYVFPSLHVEEKFPFQPLKLTVSFYRNKDWEKKNHPQTHMDQKGQLPSGHASISC